MTVTVRLDTPSVLRLTRTTKTIQPPLPEPQRLPAFTERVAQRWEAPPAALWTLSVLAMIGFMSVAFLAALPVAAAAAPSLSQTLVLDVDDPLVPVLGQLSEDCRVVLAQHGLLECAETTSFEPDTSRAVVIGPQSSSTKR